MGGGWGEAGKGREKKGGPGALPAEIFGKWTPNLSFWVVSRRTIFLFLHLQLHYLRTRDSACESLFQGHCSYLQLPSHACCAGTRSVARARTLREDARTLSSTDRAVLHYTAV